MRGIVIIALHNQQYACASANLALSLRYHNPNIHITLLTDGIHQNVFRTEHFLAFDNIKEIPKEYYTDHYGFSPAKAKLSLCKLSPYDETLYLDADGLCLGNLDSLFDKLKGSKFKSAEVKNYTQWATDEYFKEFFKVESTVTINTSWMYFEKTKVGNNEVFTQANKYFDKQFDKGLDNKNLAQKWGKYLPDEMFFNASLSKLKLSVNEDNVMYLDTRGRNMQVKGLEDYSFISYYGNQNNTSLLLREFYDKKVFVICEHFGIKSIFKMHDIMANKLVNQK